jgi:hypothetical protein
MTYLAVLTLEAWCNKGRGADGVYCGHRCRFLDMVILATLQVPYMFGAETFLLSGRSLCMIGDLTHCRDGLGRARIVLEP